MPKTPYPAIDDPFWQDMLADAEDPQRTEDFRRGQAASISANWEQRGEKLTLVSAMLEIFAPDWRERGARRPVHDNPDHVYLL